MNVNFLQNSSEGYPLNKWQGLSLEKKENRSKLKLIVKGGFNICNVLI